MTLVLASDRLADIRFCLLKEVKLRSINPLGVLYFTSNKKKYNYNSESEEMRENLKFVCTVLLDVFIHTFCCQDCVEERVSEGQLADFR